MQGFDGGVLRTFSVHMPYTPYAAFVGVTVCAVLWVKGRLAVQHARVMCPVRFNGSEGPLCAYSVEKLTVISVAAGI